jgi:hypothetical protein
MEILKKMIDPLLNTIQITSPAIGIQIVNIAEVWREILMFKS